MSEIWPPFSSADALGAWSQVVTVAVAGAASYIALHQLRESRRQGEEADAQSTFRNDLKLAFEKPESASPQRLHMKGSSNEEQYHWFVAYMLALLKKILQTNGNDLEWRRSIITSVKQHADYLRGESFKSWQLSSYAEELRRLLLKKTGRPLPKDAGAFSNVSSERPAVYS
jgi:hypothetical protein